MELSAAPGGGEPALRIPPHSVEAEQSALGALLLDNSAWDRGSDLLIDSDFYRFEHRHIYAAIGALINATKPADVITVFEELQSLGKAEECGGLVYLNALAQSVPSAANMRRYAEIVKEHAGRRMLISTADEIAASAFNPQGRALTEIFDGARQAFDVVVRAAAIDVVSAHEWAAVVRRWQPPTDLLSKEKPVTFVLDTLIASGKVGALVAGGGTGKTTLQISLGVCIAIKRRFLGCDVQQGTFVLFSGDDTQDDLDGALARIVRAMDLSEEEIETVRQKVRLHSLQGLGGDKTFAAMVNNTAVPTGLESLIVEALRGIDDVRLVGLDTLRQFSGGSTNDEQIVKYSVAGANEIARRLGCAVMISHHTGKVNYRDAVTDMYCGSGSAAIADNCRFVLLLQKTTWPDVESQVKRTGQERGYPLVLQSTRGSLLVQAPPPIYLHRENFYLDRIAGQPLTLDQVLDERDRAVLRAVRQGAQSKNAIAAAVGGKKAAVLARIDELESRGHLLNSSLNGSQTRPQFVVTTTGARLLEGDE